MNQGEEYYRDGHSSCNTSRCEVTFGNNRTMYVSRPFLHSLMAVGKEQSWGKENRAEICGQTVVYEKLLGVL